MFAVHTWFTDPSANEWKQISMFPICVKARDNGYGHLQYLGESKLVGALKLKHKSGHIRCVDSSAKYHGENKAMF